MKLETVAIEKIHPNSLQPREVIKRDKLEEMAKSITEVGLVQPIVVRPKGKIYEIISGERRWHASKIANLKEMPVIIKEINDHDMAVQSLVENIHRADLNDTEKAKFMKKIMQMEDIKSVKDLSKRIGLSNTAITNIFDTADMRDELEKISGPEISEKATASVVQETRGLTKEERIKVIAQATRQDIGGRKVRKMVSTIKKSPEPVRKAIIEEEIDYEDVAPRAEVGIPEHLAEPLVQELKKEKKIKEDFEKAELEADVSVLKGEVKTKDWKFDISADEKRLKKYEDLWKQFKFLAPAHINMIETPRLREKAIIYIRDIRDFCDTLLRNLGE